MPEAGQHIKVGIVQHLPGPDEFAIVERPGEVMYLFTKDWTPTEDSCQRMQEAIQHLIDTTWTQQWDGPDEGPSHLRSAS